MYIVIFFIGVMFDILCFGEFFKGEKFVFEKNRRYLNIYF